MKKEAVIIKNIEPTLKGKFIVGGYLRDTILGFTPNDMDFVVVGKTVEEMLAEGLKLVGKDFPVFLDSDNNEIALARTERKIGKGYNGFECNIDNVTLKDDLMRRDLTINSIAMGTDGTLYDPFGGIEDIKNKILKHTSEAFKEDPVRVLRLARLYAKLGNFAIHEDTKKLVLELKEELSSLTKERVFKEVEKALSYKNPTLFFECLKELNVLDVLFPELYKMIGVEHNSNYHAEGDVWNHSMFVLSEACSLTEDIDVRLGALYHDVLKPVAKEIYGDFYNHFSEELLQENENFIAPYITNKKIREVIYSGILYHHTIHKFFELSDKAFIQKMFKNIYFPKTVDNFKKLLLISNADSLGRIILKNGSYLFGREDSFYSKEFIDNMCLLYSGIKSVSVKEEIIKIIAEKKEIQENAELSVDSIKQLVHKKRLKEFNLLKHKLFKLEQFYLIELKYKISGKEPFSKHYYVSILANEDIDTYMLNYFTKNDFEFDVLNDSFIKGVKRISYIAVNCEYEDTYRKNKLK